MTDKIKLLCLFMLSILLAILFIGYKIDYNQNVIDALYNNWIYEEDDSLVRVGKIESLDGVIGRGGLLKPIKGGTYSVNEKMLEDLKIGFNGEHASNLGGIIAHEIAKEIDKEAFIVDPVVVDEMEDIARVSGLKGIERKSIFHALNQKAVARRYASENAKNYNDLNLIVVHLGGGVSVGAHGKGKVIDVNNALDGEGPFSPERSGSLPVSEMVKLCFSGKYSIDEVKKMLKGQGGLVSYLGSNDAKEVSERAADGDE